MENQPMIPHIKLILYRLVSVTYVMQLLLIGMITFFDVNWEPHGSCSTPNDQFKMASDLWDETSCFFFLSFFFFPDSFVSLKVSIFTRRIRSLGFWERWELSIRPLGIQLWGFCLQHAMDIVLSIVFQLRPCGNIIIRLRGGKKKASQGERGDL